MLGDDAMARAVAVEALQEGHSPGQAQVGLELHGASEGTPDLVVVIKKCAGAMEACSRAHLSAQAAALSSAVLLVAAVAPIQSGQPCRATGPLMTVTSCLDPSFRTARTTHTQGAPSGEAEPSTYASKAIGG